MTESPDLAHRIAWSLHDYGRSQTTSGFDDALYEACRARAEKILRDLNMAGFTIVPERRDNDDRTNASDVELHCAYRLARYRLLETFNKNATGEEAERFARAYRDVTEAGR